MLCQIPQLDPHAARLEIVQFEGSCRPVEHHAALQQAVKQVGHQLVAAQHLSLQPPFQAETGEGELRCLQLADVEGQVGLWLAFRIDQIPVAQGGVEAAQGQPVALKAQPVYGAITDGEGVHRQAGQLVGQRQLDGGANEVEMSDPHIAVQPVDALDLQIDLVERNRIAVAHLLRQQGVGVERVEYQPPYGDRYAGLLADPAGDGAFGALGVEQTEGNPDKEQQEGKGVEQAA